MKAKITRSKLRAMYPHVYGVGYCGINFAGYTDGDARFYNAGVYGWNADIVPVSAHTCIVTGYRPWGDDLEDVFTPEERETWRKLHGRYYSVVGYDARHAIEVEARALLLAAVARVENAS